MIALASAILVFSYSTQKNEGFPDRITGLVAETYDMYKVPEFRRMIDKEHPSINLRTNKVDETCGFRSLEIPCKFGKVSWVTVGDSYAGQYDYALLNRLKGRGDGLMSLTYEQCPFVDNLWFGNVPECLAVSEQRWKQLESLPGKEKILVAVNYDLFTGAKDAIPNSVEMGKQNFSGGSIVSEDKAWESYANNIKKLVSLGHEVYVIYPAPNPSEDVSKLVFSQLRNIDYKFHTQYTSNVNAYADAVAKSNKLDAFLGDMPGLNKIRPVDTLCENGKCKIIDKNGGLYNGGYHLSTAGINEVLSIIFK